MDPKNKQRKNKFHKVNKVGLGFSLSKGTRPLPFSREINPGNFFSSSPFFTFWRWGGGGGGWGQGLHYSCHQPPRPVAWRNLSRVGRGGDPRRREAPERFISFHFIHPPAKPRAWVGGAPSFSARSVRSFSMGGSESRGGGEAGPPSKVGDGKEVEADLRAELAQARIDLAQEQRRTRSLEDELRSARSAPWPPRSSSKRRRSW